MNFDIYDIDPSIYDEMFLADGSPREHCKHLYETLTEISPGGSCQHPGARYALVLERGHHLHGLWGR